MNRCVKARPKGPLFLSPAQRAGYAPAYFVMRPEGPRYVHGNRVPEGDRAPLGRTNISMAVTPGRCPGLRDDAPLALSHRPKGPLFLSPAQRAGCDVPNPCGLKGRDKPT